ncbi:MAG: DUF4255 domain-containing protein, partial [Bacteroidota bacterium]
MSSALAIASVNYLLKSLLEEGLTNEGMTTILGNMVTVSSLPMDKILPNQSGTEVSQLNLFLYRTTPNQGWRNVGLPSRNSRGQKKQNNPLALDLHYILTAHGETEFHRESILGVGMHTLHETPAFSREYIESTLGAIIADDDPLNRAIANSGLAEQVEILKITPEILSTEEISRLWTAFSAKYRPHAAYVVTVVLIERQDDIP